VDTWLLRRLTRRFAISRTVQRRLEAFNGVTAQALHPPAPPRAYRCERYEPFVFSVSRLSPLKRVDLLIEALAQPAGAGIRCRIAGDGECAGELRALARDRGVADRVEFLGHIDDERLVDELGRCRAVAFAPLDEDYGFVTIEAFASGKPVVTTTDSGGPAELVRDGENGRVVAPTAAALAEALGTVMSSPADAERLGNNGRQLSDAMTWRAAIERLLVV
jgi:glycosyltransferase involved in cell wall biosynthesis